MMVAIILLAMPIAQARSLRVGVSDLHEELLRLIKWYAFWVDPSEWVERHEDYEGYDAGASVEVQVVMYPLIELGERAPWRIMAVASSVRLRFEFRSVSGSTIQPFGNGIYLEPSESNEEALGSLLGITSGTGLHPHRKLADAFRGRVIPDPEIVFVPVDATNGTIYVDPAGDADFGREDVRKLYSITLPLELPALTGPDHLQAPRAHQPDASLSDYLRADLQQRWCPGPSKLTIGRFEDRDPVVFALVEHPECSAVLVLGRESEGTWTIRRFNSLVSPASPWHYTATKIRAYPETVVDLP